MHQYGDNVLVYILPKVTETSQTIFLYSFIKVLMNKSLNQMKYTHKHKIGQ